MMDRRRFISGIAFGVLAVAIATAARQPGSVPRIGVLWPVSEDAEELEAFRKGLRELGYVEGQSIAIEYRYARGKDELLRGLAAELVSLDVTWPIADRRPIGASGRRDPIFDDAAW